MWNMAPVVIQMSGSKISLLTFDNRICFFNLVKTTIKLLNKKVIIQETMKSFKVVIISVGTLRISYIQPD